LIAACGAMELEHHTEWLSLNPLANHKGEELMEGDMAISKSHHHEVDHNGRKVIPNRRWPRTISYYVDPARHDQRQRFREVFDYMQSVTCLTFRELTGSKPTSGDYINIIKANGCWSYVGMWNWDGKGQDLSIGDGCTSKGTIMHEVFHALGSEHEQCRPDRDQFLKLFLENVQDAFKYAYDINSRSINYSIPYDYSSVMQYHLTAFTKNNRRTMGPINPTDEGYIANRAQQDELSFRDRAMINRMYSCDNSCSSKPACNNGGYIDRFCRCHCPPGTSGTSCERITGSYYPAKTCPDQEIRWDTTVRSRNYPNNYPRDLDCFYTIKTPSNKRAQLTFTDFDLLYRHTGTGRCLWDKVELRSSNMWDPEPSEIFCEGELKGQTRTYGRGQEILMYFRSQYDWNKGFDMRVRFID